MFVLSAIAYPLIIHSLDGAIFNLLQIITTYQLSLTARIFRNPRRILTNLVELNFHTDYLATVAIYM